MEGIQARAKLRSLAKEGGARAVACSASLGARGQQPWLAGQHLFMMAASFLANWAATAQPLRQLPQRSGVAAPMASATQPGAPRTANPPSSSAPSPAAGHCLLLPRLEEDMSTQLSSHGSCMLSPCRAPEAPNLLPPSPEFPLGAQPVPWEDPQGRGGGSSPGCCGPSAGSQRSQRLECRGGRGGGNLTRGGKALASNSRSPGPRRADEAHRPARKARACRQAVRRALPALLLIGCGRRAEASPKKGPPTLVEAALSGGERGAAGGRAGNWETAGPEKPIDAFGSRRQPAVAISVAAAGMAGRSHGPTQAPQDPPALGAVGAAAASPRSLCADGNGFICLQPQTHVRGCHVTFPASLGIRGAVTELFRLSLPHTESPCRV